MLFEGKCKYTRQSPLSIQDQSLAQKTNQGLSKVPEVVKARRVHIRFGEDVGSQLTVANFGHAAHVLVFQVLFRDEKVNLGCSTLAS